MASSTPPPGPMEPGSLIGKKFIDLIRRSSGKWVNLDPSVPIPVGSYGNLNDGGMLSVEGNIYDDPEIRSILKDDGLDPDFQRRRPKLTESEEDLIITSTGIRRGQLLADETVADPLIASASIKGTWKFQKTRRSALVIIYAPLEVSIPKPVLEKLLKVDVKVLEDKVVVTSALRCSAYLMYLSDKSGETLSLALNTRRSGTGLGGLGGGELGATGWWTDIDTALLRKGFDPDGRHRFNPLVTLHHKAIPPWPWWKRRDPSDPVDQYAWEDIYPTWKPLDDEGEEIED